MPPDKTSAKFAVCMIYRGMRLKAAACRRMADAVRYQVFEEAALDLAATAVSMGWVTLDDLADSVKKGG